MLQGFCVKTPELTDLSSIKSGKIYKIETQRKQISILLENGEKITVSEKVFKKYFRYTNARC